MGTIGQRSRPHRIRSQHFLVGDIVQYRGELVRITNFHEVRPLNQKTPRVKFYFKAVNLWGVEFEFESAECEAASQEQIESFTRIYLNCA